MPPKRRSLPSAAATADAAAAPGSSSPSTASHTATPVAQSPESSTPTSARARRTTNRVSVPPVRVPDWQEPEPTAPVPTLTGFALGVLPPANHAAKARKRVIKPVPGSAADGAAAYVETTSAGSGSLRKRKKAQPSLAEDSSTPSSSKSPPVADGSTDNDTIVVSSAKKTSKSKSKSSRSKSIEGTDSDALHDGDASEGPNDYENGNSSARSRKTRASRLFNTGRLNGNAAAHLSISPPLDTATSETDEPGEEEEEEEEEVILTDSESSPPPTSSGTTTTKILISKNKNGQPLYGAVKSASVDANNETKIKLKFQKTFDDYFVKKSTERERPAKTKQSSVRLISSSSSSSSSSPALAIKPTKMALPPLRFKTATPEVHYLDVSKNTAARRRRLTKKPPRAQGYQLTMPLTPDNFSNSHRGRVPITEGLTGDAAARQAQSDEVEAVSTPSAATPPPPDSPSVIPDRTREKARARESSASGTTAQTEEEIKEVTTSKPAERRASRLSAAHTVDDTTDEPPASEPPVLASQSSNNAKADTELMGSRRKRSEMEHTPQPEEQSIRRQKRVKVSPIKKRYGQRENAFGFGPAAPLPSTRASANLAVDDPDDPTKFNDDFCSACGGIGRFLCCEGCPKSFHFTCTDPPYDESDLPEGSWFCKSCHAKRHPPPIMPRGLFAELIEQIETRNPACFVLPKEIRERYEGVTSTEFGEYQDVQDTKAKRPRNGFIEEPDPFRLTDKNGKAILCFKCGLSALHDRKMISCDYCPLHWHLDCLDPPMSSIPTISQRKWRCPNHVNRELIKCRRLRNAKLVSVSLRRGFINNGDIEVENESSDDDGNAAGNEVLVKPSRLHFFDNWSEDPFNKTSAFDRRKIATYTIEDVEQNVVYRVSERGLVLDFLDKVNLLPHTRKRAPRPVPLSELDRLVVLPYQEREFVRNLAYFNQQFTPEAVTRQSMSSLLDAALALDDTVSLSSPMSDDEEVPAEAALETTSRSSSTDHDESLSANTAATEQVETEEVTEDKETLLAIQKLMRVKGKDALMKFLLG